MPQKTAIIIGAGPAGLTAAYELVKSTNIQPIVLEMTDDIGGISKTVNYKGNRMDIGGHRFFSKSDVVMNWWQNVLPIENTGQNSNDGQTISYQNKTKKINLGDKQIDSAKRDDVLLIRRRLSRIFYLGRFFDYPISLKWKTLSNLGFYKLTKIGFTYLWVHLFPIKNVNNLEEFFVNRFGRELYETFFKDYTEKVWGLSCEQISSEWGEQRIKKLSIKKALNHALRKIFTGKSSLEQKNTETSLIEQFLYPKYGPGQMWETVAKIVEEKGGTIIKNSRVEAVHLNGKKIEKVTAVNPKTNEKTNFEADFLFSTMPVKYLIRAFKSIKVPEEVQKVSEGLVYRDFITVGLLLNKLKIKNDTNFKTHNNLIPDNWIYIQEKQVKLGRLQVFNNWSPHLVNDPEKVWLGLEYFCNQGDALWQMDDDDFINFAIGELDAINIIDKKEVIDATIIRMPKTYPAYFGSYSEFPKIREFTDTIENLFLIGRNGMHKYNNQDHSMLTAMEAVKNIINGKTTKENIWEINTEMEYHEKSKA